MKVMSARNVRIALAGVLMIIALVFALRFATVSAAHLAVPFDLIYETAAYATIELIWGKVAVNAELSALRRAIRPTARSCGD